MPEGPAHIILRQGGVNQDISVGGRGKNYFELRWLNQEVSPPQTQKIYIDTTFFLSKNK